MKVFFDVTTMLYGTDRNTENYDVLDMVFKLIMCLSLGLAKITISAKIVE